MRQEIATQSVAILVIGRHEEILNIVVRLINARPSWRAQGAITDEEAKMLFVHHSFDLVLLGGGIEMEEEARLRLFFQRIKPHVPVVQHYGGGSGLLFNEIQQALAIIS